MVFGCNVEWEVLGYGDSWNVRVLDNVFWLLINV